MLYSLLFMSAEFDISFCNTCPLRGVIGPDTLCAREALGFAQEVSQYVGHVVIDLDEGTVTEHEPGTVPYGDYFTHGVLRCIESVSKGGRPIAASEE